MSVDELKDAGNKAFQAKDYALAIEKFSAAIAIDPKNHVLYSNRSAAFSSQGKYDEALEDANTTVSIKPDWAKGYGRKGAALFGLGDYPAARDAYNQVGCEGAIVLRTLWLLIEHALTTEIFMFAFCSFRALVELCFALKGLALEPTNAQLIEGLKSADQKLIDENPNPMNDLGRQFTSPEALAKFKTNPATSAFFNEPDFVKKLDEIRANPHALQGMLADKRLLQCLSVFLDIGNMTGAGAAPFSQPSAQASTQPVETPKPAETAKPAEAPKSASQPAPEPAKAAAPPADDDAMDTATDATSAANKAEALKVKELGSAAYKARNFDEALKHFNAAHELDPTDMVYRLNTAAVYFELKDYEAAIKAGLESSEIGRDNRADFSIRAKAFARVARAYLALDKLDETLTYLNKSLTEHRTPDIAKLKQEVEKKIKERDRAAFINPELSLAAKEAGNDLFKAGKYPEALAKYNEAIARNPDDGKLYSNRAACYIKLVEFGLALADCNKCIKLEPTFIKAYLRKGNVLLLMKNTTEAMDAFNKALDLDPTNAEASQGVESCYKAMSGSGMTQQERAQAAMQDPEIQNILQDPVMRQILDQMSSDPRAAQEHMKNPEVNRKIQRLLQAGVIGMK